MGSSKASAKHYIVPKDILYCIEFFAQPKNQRPTPSTNHVPPKLKLTMDTLSSINTERRVDTERRKGDRVVRWLDAMPENFARIPGDSRVQVRAAQRELLEMERDRQMREREMENRMLLAQQLQPQFNNTERGLTLNLDVGVEEYLKLIEPDRQRLFEHWRFEAEEAKRQRNKKPTDQSNLRPAMHIETAKNDPQNKEQIEMDKMYSADADLSSDYGPPPPIPPRSKLRPRPTEATSSKTAPGSIQQAELLNAGSSQYSSVDVLPKEAPASGTSGVVKDLESGVKKDNPGLVAELRLGMERRRQRESAKDEELEKEREQESSKATGWALKLWK